MKALRAKWNMASWLLVSTNSYSFFEPLYTQIQDPVVSTPYIQPIPSFPFILKGRKIPFCPSWHPAVVYPEVITRRKYTRSSKDEKESRTLFTLNLNAKKLTSDVSKLTLLQVYFSFICLAFSTWKNKSLCFGKQLFIIQLEFQMGGK